MSIRQCCLFDTFLTKFGRIFFVIPFGLKILSLSLDKVKASYTLSKYKELRENVFIQFKIFS